MVKRDMVVPGTVVQVAKLSPGPAGPEFTGKFALHEKLIILSKPYSRAGLNLVLVRREKTDTQTALMYAFITNYCRLPTEKAPKRVKKSESVSTMPAPAEEVLTIESEGESPSDK